MTNEEAIAELNIALSEESITPHLYYKAISAIGAIDRIKAERDALMNDLKIAGDCHSCLNNKRENLYGICSRCFIFGEIRWEWRGIEDV